LANLVLYPFTQCYTQGFDISRNFMGSHHQISEGKARSPAPVALVTGSARRLGSAIARYLHDKGYDVVLHYRQSKAQTQALLAALNTQRPGSAHAIQAPLSLHTDYQALMDSVMTAAGRLDLLVNNASAFFPTPVGQISVDDFQQLFDSNVAGPLLLSQAAGDELARHRGSIVNLVDIHADKPLKGYPVYSMAKAANAMMVKSLAKELAPHVRVNGVAPGCILWPEESNANTELTDQSQQDILSRIALGRTGSPQDIAEAVYFLATAEYVTGHILVVDGGRSLNM